MMWQKLGLVFEPARDASWIASHACAPVPIIMDDGICRVFFAGRDARNRSHIGWFDIDLADPTGPVRAGDRPLAAPGPLGHFDDHGIYAGSAVRIGDRLRIYTIGWSPGVRQPLFYASIGALETSDFGMTYDWRSTVPVLGRSEFDPCHVTGPWVVREGDLWRMWYVSGLSWEETDEGLKSRYHIKYAESDDGLAWRRAGLVAIDFNHPAESNIARPCIVHGPGGYEAWFSYHRGQGYRIGYARSPDGLVFDRNVPDPPVIEPSQEPFETDAVCHPAVVSFKGRRFMFYNGNQFGKDGVALAVERADGQARRS